MPAASIGNRWFSSRPAGLLTASRFRSGGVRTSGVVMGLGQRVSGMIAFFREGRPRGAPDVGYSPLLALLPRRVTDDEITAIARKLLTPHRLGIDNSDIDHADLDHADVGVAIIGVTDAMPSTTDVERVLVEMRSAGRQGD
jgi:hypothetical protein